MLLEPLSLRAHLHAFKYRGHASGQQSVAAFDLNQAQTASANIAQAFKMAKGWDVDVVFPRDLKDSLARAGADFVSIDLQSFYANSFAHANTSVGT
jgi:hypothetical protein